MNKQGITAVVSSGFIDKSSAILGTSVAIIAMLMMSLCVWTEPLNWASARGALGSSTVEYLTRSTAASSSEEPSPTSQQTRPSEVPSPSSRPSPTKREIDPQDQIAPVVPQSQRAQTHSQPATNPTDAQPTSETSAGNANVNYEANDIAYPFAFVSDESAIFAAKSCNGRIIYYESPKRQYHVSPDASSPKRIDGLTARMYSGRMGRLNSPERWLPVFQQIHPDAVKQAIGVMFPSSVDTQIRHVQVEAFRRIGQPTTPTATTVLDFRAGRFVVDRIVETEPL